MEKTPMTPSGHVVNVNTDHEKRLGAMAYCKNCRFAFPFRDQGNMRDLTVCRAAPPLFQFVPSEVGKGTQTWAAREVLRVVGPDYGCGAFQPYVAALS